LDGIIAAVGLVSRVYEDADFRKAGGEVPPCAGRSQPVALAFTQQQFYQLDGLASDEGLRLAPMSRREQEVTPRLFARH